MQKNRIKPKKHLQKRHPTTKDNARKKPNIIDIINNIPKKFEYDLLHGEIEQNFKYCENCIAFLKAEYPKALEKLNFIPEIHNLGDLVGKLTETICKFGYSIEYTLNEESDSAAEDENSINVLFPVPFDDYTFFLLEGKHLDAIPKELRPGYARILKKVANFTITEEDDFTMHDYENEYNCHFSFALEVLDDDENSTSYDLIQDTLEFYRNCMSEFNAYLETPIEVTYSFNPSNEFESKLKSLIINGLENQKFNGFTDLAENYDVYEDGGLSFRSCLLVYWDEKSEFEGWLIQMKNDYARNGSSSPYGYFSVSDGKVEKMTNEKDVDDFVKCQAFIVELNGLLNNN